MGNDEYKAYLREEWDLFVEHPEEREAGAREIRRHITPIGRVADVGCGAGQELLPYVREAVCIGIDAAADGLPLARELLSGVGASRVVYACAGAEALPLRTGTVDLVISRLVLPYTHVPTALGEAARVLRAGGGFSAQIHTPQFYVDRLRRAMAGRNRASARYALRVLRTGALFHLTGKHRAVGGTLETFLTVARLRQLASSAGLDFVTHIASWNPRAPQLLFRRR